MIEAPVTRTNSVVYTTPAAKSPFCSSCGLTTGTSTYVQVAPTPTAVQFQGAAAKAAPGGIMAVIAAMGAGAVGAVALIL
jgi:hypothetical protein